MNFCSFVLFLHTLSYQILWLLILNSNILLVPVSYFFQCNLLNIVTGKTYFIKGTLSCDSCIAIYLIICSKYREQYLGSVQIKYLSTDLEFTNLILRLTKIVVVLQDILIINVAVLIINMFIWKWRLLSRYLIITCVVLRIYCVKEKNNGRRNCLLTCMEWIILMIYIVWKRNAIENNFFWTDVLHF